MHPNEKLIAIAVALVLLAGPVLLGLAGHMGVGRAQAGTGPDRVMPLNWNLTVTSALLYTLAFNVTFFIQELFLVLPKALTPGLRPTLFHNNHNWEGENPLANLLQGTGALAIFLTGIACAWLLQRGPGRSSTIRLFLIWMTYNGLLQSLPQVIVGAIEPENDVGMAMGYLHFDTTAKTAAAFAALVAIPWVGLWLRRPLLNLAQDPAHIADARARTSFIFHVATLPALTAIPLIILFRVPRHWVEVVMVPAVVAGIGIAWLQAGAWLDSRAKAEGGHDPRSLAYSAGAVLLLLMVFQFLLRRGVHFY